MARATRRTSHANTQFVGVEKMVRWRVRAAIKAATVAGMAVFAAHAVAADFRMSARGESLVRPAGFQQAVEEILPQEAMRVEGHGPSPWADPCAGFDAGSCTCGVGACPAPCPPWRYWGSFEFILWWQKGHDPLPLVTTGPDFDNPGILGVEGTEILYSRDAQLENARPGGRLSLGAWFDPCCFSGVGARWFSLGENSTRYEQASDAFPVLARPFFNEVREEEDAFRIAFPGITTGAVAIENWSRVHSGDVFYRRMLFQSGWRRLDLIGGYQFARIDSKLMIASTQTIEQEGGEDPLGTVIQISDSFDTRNSYDAGEIGLWGVYDSGPVTWSVLAKVGLGTMRQRIAVAGQRITAAPDETPVVTDQGLLAVSTNSGVLDRDVFTVSPEVALNGAYHVNEWIDITFGYTFVLWNHVALSSEQLDRHLNPTQLTGQLQGPARPAVLAPDTSYFVHGLNFGVQCAW